MPQRLEGGDPSRPATPLPQRGGDAPALVAVDPVNAAHARGADDSLALVYVQVAGGAPKARGAGTLEPGVPFPCQTGGPVEAGGRQAGVPPLAAVRPQEGRRAVAQAAPQRVAAQAPAEARGAHAVVLIRLAALPCKGRQGCRPPPDSQSSYAVAVGSTKTCSQRRSTKSRVTT